MSRYMTYQEAKKHRPDQDQNPNWRKWGTPCAARHHHYFTTAKHPYEGTHFKLRVTPEESERVQEKAFKLGYKWINGGQTVEYPDFPYFYIKPDGLAADSKLELFDSRTDYITLTVDQFMRGDMPEKAAEKVDAYISNGLLYIKGRSDRPEAQHCLDKLHTYNILSEEEFKAKHPEKKKLMFKDWEVKVFDKSISIGCESFHKTTANRFLERCDQLNKHSISASEFYIYLDSHRQELGLECTKVDDIDW